jgi:hypothetical protein
MSIKAVKYETPRSLARTFGCSVQNILLAINERQLPASRNPDGPAYKHGRPWRIPVSGIIAFLEDRVAKHEAEAAKWNAFLTTFAGVK